MKSTLQLDSRVVRLEAVERKLTDALAEIRTLRVELGNESRDKGVLGSRGLTGFIIEQLQAKPQHDITVIELLQLAERAGYQPITPRNLSKRLTEYRIRTGMIGVRSEGRWYWKGEGK